jgi:hypothetical protein
MWCADSGDVGPYDAIEMEAFEADTGGSDGLAMPSPFAAMGGVDTPLGAQSAIGQLAGVAATANGSDRIVNIGTVVVTGSPGNYNSWRRFNGVWVHAENVMLGENGNDGMTEGMRIAEAVKIAQEATLREINQDYVRRTWGAQAVNSQAGAQPNQYLANYNAINNAVGSIGEFFGDVRAASHDARAMVREWVQDSDSALGALAKGFVYAPVAIGDTFLGGLATMGEVVTDPSAGRQALHGLKAALADPGAAGNQLLEAARNASLEDWATAAAAGLTQTPRSLLLGPGAVSGDVAVLSKTVNSWDDLGVVANSARTEMIGESRAQSTLLREKYGALSSEQRAARIDELSRLNYERRISEAIINPAGLQLNWNSAFCRRGKRFHIQVHSSRVNNRQECVFRYLSEDGLNTALRDGSVRGYTTTEFSHSSSAVANGAQILPEWGVPQYVVAIPVNKLNGFSLARPMGNRASVGWEPFTNSYPQAGAGGWSQFLINEVPIDQVYIFRLKP